MITTKAEFHLEREISDRLFVISVKLERYKQWIPGMFMQISLKERTASEPWLDGHSFSFASWGDEKATILVRKEGFFTSKLVERSKEGFTTSVRYPLGDFHLNSERDKIFLSAGAGVSVFLSYLDYINLSKIISGYTFLFHSANEMRESVTNIYRKSIPGSVMIKQFITNPEEPGYTGRLTVENLKITLNDLENKDYFICGPPNFNSKLFNELNYIGIHAKVEQWERRSLSIFS